MADSPALDAGSDDRASDAGLTTDQRGAGFPRLRGQNVDIGAYEAVLGDSAIGGTVWNDRDADGLPDAAEPALAGVTVRLYIDDGDGIFQPGGADMLVGPRTTLADGTFEWTGLPSGGYWLDMDPSADLPGYLQSVGSDPMLVTVAPGETANHILLGFYKPLTVNAANDQAVDTDGLTSLREALLQAKAAAGYDIIRFDPALADATIHLTPSLGQLLIDSDLEIDGPGANLLAVDAGGDNRVFSVGSGADVLIRGLTVSGGQSTRGGGLFLSEDASVRLEGVVLADNLATVKGGAIYGDFGSSLTLVDSTLWNNAAINASAGQGRGGGVYLVGDGEIVNSTLWGNRSSYSGGGIYAESGQLTVTNATVSGNTADSDGDGGGVGGGIYNDAASATLANTIVAGNRRGVSSSDDLAGAFAGGYNLVGVAGGSTGLVDGVNGNLAGTSPAPLDAGLMALRNNGGPTPTMALELWSPALDAGDNAAASALAGDQRGLARLVDHDGDGTATVDIGAYEAAAPIVVESGNDEAVDSDGFVSLREALALAGVQDGFDVVVFGASLLAGGDLRVELSEGPLLLDSSVAIEGPAGAAVTIDAAGGAGGALEVASGSFVLLRNVTVAGGTAEHGAGIRNLGELELWGVTLTGNQATGDGGGIWNAGTLTLGNVTVSGNAAGGSGGGIYQSAGSLAATNATVLNNRADADDDASGTGGGIAVASGTATLHNTVVAGNARGTAAPADNDVSGAFDPAGSYNLVGVADGSTGLATGAGTRYGTAADPREAMLGDLADNGGPTATHAVLAGSPVIDAGSNARALTAGLETDQRGENRFKDALDDGVARVDIGAYEQQYRLNIAPTLTAMQTLGGAVEDRGFNISWEMLAAAGNEADVDGDALGFRIESIGAGELLKSGLPVVAGETVIWAGQTLTWTPPAGVTGTVAGAFSVRAFDGLAASASAIAVSIAVTPVADPVNYAVLFSGGDEPAKNFPRYYQNLRAMYQTLVTQYGLAGHNIYVLYADGRDTAADQPEGTNSDMSFAEKVYSATAANLQAVLGQLALKVDANDHFLFWSYDHGVGSTDPGRTGEEVLTGWGELIGDSQVASWLGGVNAGYATYVFTECFSGGMLDDLLPLGPGRFGAASSTHYEASYGDAFPAAFTQALAAGYRYTQDAFDYAFAHDAHASDGEGPGGAWSYGVEHPWSAGANFPIFALAGQSNGSPVLDGIVPLKAGPEDYNAGTGRYELTISYDMLMAAAETFDPDGDAIVFRVESVDIGTLTKGGSPVVAGVTDLRFGQSLQWRSPVGATGIQNAFSVRLLDEGSAVGTPKAVPIRIGAPAGGPTAADDAFTIQTGVVEAYLGVLDNDADGAAAVQSVGIALHGTVVLSNGQVRYTPSAGFQGQDSFHYVVSGPAGATDMAEVTVSVVDYDPNAGGGLILYQATELTPPPGWAGLPEEWDWTTKRQVLEAYPWTTTMALSLAEDGTVAVRVERTDTPDNTLWYVGGTQASYLWNPDYDDPYWSHTEGLVSTNVLMLLHETEWAMPNDPSRNILHSLSVQSLQNGEEVPMLEYTSPDNANEPYPPEGGILVHAGRPDQLWYDLEAHVLPVDINASGIAVANDTGTWGSDPQQAVVWDTAGAYSSGTTLAGWAGSNRSGGEAINSTGQVVGWAEYSYNNYHAFLYDPQQANGTATPVDLGTLADHPAHTQSWALGINASGQVVGCSGTSIYDETTGVAFLWDDGVMTGLGTLSDPAGGLSGWSVARDINDQGAIVGSSDGHAVVWIGGQLYDLNALAPGNWTLTDASEINNAGQILATGTVGGQTRAFFLELVPLASAHAVDDGYATLNDQVLVVGTPGLMGNDTDAVTVSGVDTGGTLGQVNWSADGSFSYDPGGAFDHLTEGQTAQDRFTYTIRDAAGGSSSGTVTITVTGAAPLSSFHVVSMTPSAWGATVVLSDALDVGTLNLYDGQDASADAADVKLVGQAGGEVRGSLVLDSDGRTLRFVATGGPLAADSYTLTLAGRSDGLVDQTGRALDGDADGADGGDWTGQFTVTADAARTVSLSDFARGPGQAVDLGGVGTGMTLRIDQGDGVQAINLTLQWDPALLTVSGIAPTSALTGWGVTANLTTPGRAVLSASGVDPLASGPLDLFKVTATVPGDAPYGASHALRLTALSLNGGEIAARADAAVHKVLYFGDATGNGGYSGLDAVFIHRVAAELDSGFDAADWTDPRIIADVHPNGVIDAMDASFVSRETLYLMGGAASYDQAQIPDLPDPQLNLNPAGIDPTVSLPSPTSLAPGETTTLAVSIDQAEGLQSVELTIDYDPAVVDATGVTLGSLLAGWQLLWDVDEASGRVLITANSTGSSLGDGGGTLLSVQLEAVAAGSSNLVLGGQLNEGLLVMSTVDGQVAVQAPAAVVLGRKVFYNNSTWDGNNAAAGSADDAAIATDKSALLGGGTAGFANYTSYSRGLNGIMIDIAGLAGVPTAADFTFKTGNTNTTSTWANAPAPLSVTVRQGAGVNGSDRVTIIWADNNLDAVADSNEAVSGKWLEVTVLATANTGLVQADTFYFGNAVGESGDSAANALVNATDVLGARDNPHGPFNRAGINDAFDYNRDRLVNATDVLLARDHQTGPFTALRLIAPPVAATGEIQEPIALGVTVTPAAPAAEEDTATDSLPTSALQPRIVEMSAIAKRDTQVGTNEVLPSEDTATASEPDDIQSRLFDTQVQVDLLSPSWMESESEDSAVDPEGYLEGDELDILAEFELIPLEAGQ